MLHVFPKRIYTVWLGWFADTRVSRRLIPWYIRKFDIDLAEAELPPADYTTLKSLFTRRLTPGARDFAGPGLLSPVDGVVTALGQLDKASKFYIKGHWYSAAELLADGPRAALYEGGMYFVLYLSPRDYHRIHMPLTATITAWTHIPGALYPVNDTGLRALRCLYAKNERVVTHARAERGDLALVKVGALGVGTVRTTYHSQPWPRGQLTGGTVQVEVEQGQEVGHFELGSTVIVLAAAGLVSTVAVAEGDAVRAGAPLAH